MLPVIAISTCKLCDVELVDKTDDCRDRKFDGTQKGRCDVDDHGWDLIDDCLSSGYDLENVKHWKRVEKTYCEQVQNTLGTAVWNYSIQQLTFLLQ